MTVFRFFIFLFIVQFQTFVVNAQGISFPEYHPPLDIPLVLAANFGELRPNHFHMGLDFKTNGRIGYNLYSIADGFVSRVKVSPYGYGNVIYIDHPDGRTSVYAHCSEFKGKVDSIVKRYQYLTQTNEVEVFPVIGEVQVARGEIIALSGNSGSSTAPHLHFEIRETISEAALNPLVYGFDLSDHRSPEIRKLKIFAVNTDGYQIPGKSKEVIVSLRAGKYSIANNELIIPASFCSPTGGIGFAFDVIDRLDGASNQCGLYGTKLFVDSIHLFGQQLNRVSFEESRFVNTHRDLNSGGKYHKAYRTTTNPLGIYTTDNLGVIKIKPGGRHEVVLHAFDPKNNNSELNFAIKIADGNISSDYMPDKKTHLYPADTFVMNNRNWSIKAPSLSVYEPTRLPLGSSVAHFCDATVEVQNSVEIRLKLENPALPISSYYIAVGNRNLPTQFEEGWLIAKSKYAGNYLIKTDVTPPSLRPLSYTSTKIVKSSTLKFILSDIQTGIAEYNLFLDGKWTIMEYESKGDVLFFTRPTDLTIGVHHMMITAKDGCGNELIYETNLDFQ